MGLIEKIFSVFFGGSRNAVVEMAEVFRENAEAGAVRAATLQSAALNQFATEFTNPQKGLFDRFMDGVNRVPRPAMALGTLALFLSAMFDPIWFQDRMLGLSTVPQPLWWLLGAIVSFYFGARHQLKGQDFQREIVRGLADVKTIMPEAHDTPTPPQVRIPNETENAAIADWHRWRGHTS